MTGHFIGILLWGRCDWVHAYVAEEEQGDLTWCFLNVWELLSNYADRMALNAATWFSREAAFQISV